MEATLIPNFHYIEIKDDYSDLNDRLEYYIKNLDKLKEISSNANNYVVSSEMKMMKKLYLFW